MSISKFKSIALLFNNCYKQCFFAVIILLNMIVINISHGWHDTGHMLVSNIAYRYLDPSIIKEVNNIIEVDGNVYPNNNSFVTAANWPDDIKTHDIHLYNTWHYQDKPFSLDGSEITAKAYTGDAIKALNNLRAIIKSKKSNNHEKTRALKFFIHIVGDLHQPLHVTHLVSKQYPNGDRGGNSFKLQGNYRSLHSLWDSGLMYLQPMRERPVSDSSKELLNKYANEFIAENPISHFDKSVITADFSKWQDEGYEYTKENIYKNITERAKPSSEYIQYNLPFMKQRIALAGYRLANQLNCLYGTASCIK